MCDFERWQGLSNQEARLDGDGRTSMKSKPRGWESRHEWRAAAGRSRTSSCKSCAGHPDLEGLCRALSDWGAELRLLEKEG